MAAARSSLSRRWIDATPTSWLVCARSTAEIRELVAGRGWQVASKAREDSATEIRNWKRGVGRILSVRSSNICSKLDKRLCFPLHCAHVGIGGTAACFCTESCPLHVESPSYSVQD